MIDLGFIRLLTADVRGRLADILFNVKKLSEKSQTVSLSLMQILSVRRFTLSEERLKLNKSEFKKAGIFCQSSYF